MGQQHSGRGADIGLLWCGAVRCGNINDGSPTWQGQRLGAPLCKRRIVGAELIDEGSVDLQVKMLMLNALRLIDPTASATTVHIVRGRRPPHDSNFGSLLMLAVTAGSFLVVTWIATKGLFFLLKESPIR
jgi:hypothetical protein